MNDNKVFTIAEVMPIFSDARMASAAGRFLISNHSPKNRSGFIQSIHACTGDKSIGKDGYITSEQLLTALSNALQKHLQNKNSGFYKMQYDTYRKMVNVLIYELMTPGKLYVLARIRMNELKTWRSGDQRIVKMAA